MLPTEAEELVERYLAVADRLLPGRVQGFYVVGSAALGAYRPGRSDLDFVAVIDGGLRPGEVRRLRALHVRTGARSARRALARGLVEIPGTCNGVFVSAQDLTRPVTAMVPLASHVGHRFATGRGFDVNPVVWKVLADRGIAVRGPEPATLGLCPEPDALRAWNLANLDAYWSSWATRLRARSRRAALRSGWIAAWGVLGPPRLHHTIATGQVISKEAAGHYAVEALGPRWRPLVDDALAYREGRPLGRSFPEAVRRTRATADFVHEVVRSAHDL